MAGKHAKKKAKKLARLEHRLLAGLSRQGDAATVRALTPLAKAADEPPLLALALGTLVLGAVLRRPDVIRSGARMTASHLVATGLKTALKASVDRRRPNVAAARGPRLAKGSGAGDTDENAFPSGHTAGAVAVAQAVAHELPAVAAPARIAAGTAGALQVPRGAHYVSDVLAGAAIGFLSERIAGWAMAAADRAAERRAERRAMAEAEAHPS